MSFFKKKEQISNVADNMIVAPALADMIDITTISDPVFAQKMMGDGVAFQFKENKVTLCAPANGILSVLFPTGHAFGIKMNNGVQLLVHCGIDTVKANGAGFKILHKKQGDRVKAGDPILIMDVKKLSKSFETTTMLIIVDSNHKDIHFIPPKQVKKGESILMTGTV
ncbi:PTS sugar transporter subunit IIA [Absicoccus porci]|jgi:PTS system glucose-specific IIA component|uniref:PTS sugar transporter subunit IIA n=1 Tax=Absicoccus porci TaxID=2486576 RepID=UPI003D8B293F